MLPYRRLTVHASRRRLENGGRAKQEASFASSNTSLPFSAVVAIPGRGGGGQAQAEPSRNSMRRHGLSPYLRRTARPSADAPSRAPMRGAAARVSSHGAERTNARTGVGRSTLSTVMACRRRRHHHAMLGHFAFTYYQGLEVKMKLCIGVSAFSGISRPVDARYSYGQSARNAAFASRCPVAHRRLAEFESLGIRSMPRCPVDRPPLAAASSAP